MLKRLFATALSFVLLAAVYAMPALADNELMSLNSVPPHIKLAAERALPGAKFNGANFDIGDDRKPLYEVEGTLNGQTAEVDVYLDGTIEEIELGINTSDVPANVSANLNQYASGFKIASVNKSHLANGVTRYEFRGKLGDTDTAIEIPTSAEEIKIIESGRR